MQDDIERLQALIQPLLDQNTEPNIFIKPENVDEMEHEEAEEGQPDINKWSLYSAYW